LYLATDAGVFYTYQGSTSWQVLGAALPPAPVTDLRIHYPSMTLLAATYGRSMYKYDLSTLTAIASIQPGKDKITIRLYPNPFKDHSLIQLDLPAASTGKLSVYDMSGHAIKIIREGLFKKGINNISLTQNKNAQKRFRNGIIFVRFVSSSGASITLKGICAD
jgi:hypothetical protein